MTQHSSRGVGYSATTPTEGQLLAKDTHAALDGTRRGVLCFHGHAGDCGQYQPASTSLGAHVEALVDYLDVVVLAIDDAGGAAWSDQTAMDRATDGYTYLTARAKSPKILVVGWSMGGLTALNWIKRNPTLVAAAWLWAPCSDLDWANSTAAYSPAYGGTVANNAGWTTEIGAAFPSYSSSSVGFRVRDEYASWRGLGIPIKVCHASDDATIPPAQSTAFVAGVNDAQVTSRSPAPTGDHTGLFSNVPVQESVQFFQPFV